MNRIITSLLGTLFALNVIFAFPSASWAVSSNLGLQNGSLSACPSSPNCAVSQNADEAHYIEPLVYQTDTDKAKEALLKVLSVVPRTEVVEQKPNYIRAESKSRIFKFVDDVEFYFPDGERLIHVRSASRVGDSDLGVNRRRLEQIRLALQDLNI